MVRPGGSRALRAAGVALALAGAGDQALATENDPWLWVAPGLYGMERTACSPARATTAATALTAVIHPQLCGVFGAGNPYARHFAVLVKQHFSNVEDQFGAHLGAGVSPDVQLRSTLVVSLRLSRATFEMVPRLASVDVFAPVTTTLDITNVATGEVVFTKTITDVREGSFGSSQAAGEVVRQFDSHLRSVIQRLVTEAAAEFRPQRQSVPIVAATDIPGEGKVYIGAAGRVFGLKAGDTLGLDARVLHAGPDYAVLKAPAGTLKVGDSLSRFVSTPAQLLNRPTLLSVMEAVPEGYSPLYLEQLFQDAVSEGGVLSPTPVNPSFTLIRRDAVGASASTQGIDSRSLPDYIAVIKIVLLPDAEFPSNVPQVSHARFEAHALVELVDNAGRILESWAGKALIEDMVAGANRLSPFQRRDAVIRNAIKDVANQMAGFKPRPFQVPLRVRQNRFEIDDPTGAVTLNATLPVLRRIGRVAGIASPDVLVPIGAVNPVEAQGGVVLADNAGVVDLNARNGDLVAFEMAGMPVTNRSLLGQCADADGHPKAEARGDVPVFTGFDFLRNAVARNGVWPAGLSSLPALLARYQDSFATWSKLAAAKARAFDTCYVPVVVGQSSAGGAAIALAAGFTVRKGDVVIASGGSQTSITPTQLPASAAQAARQAMLQSDLAKFLPMLGATAARKITSKQ